MVSARPPISISTSPLTKPLTTVSNAQVKIGITITFILNNFLVLWQVPNICLSYRFLWFSLCDSQLLLLLLFLECFTPWLPDGFSLEFQWQHVSSSFQDSSQYSGRSNPYNNPLVTASRASITIVIIVTSMFYSFFNSLTSSIYLSLFSLSFN